VAPTIRPGMTERQIAWEIEKAMHELGAEGPSFQTMVAAGPNGAQPHAIVSDRPLQAGEPIVIDMGALYGGYCSDMTRTICLGEPDEKFTTIYNVVEEAQRRAKAACHAGMRGAELDAVARDYITAKGYGDYFGHGLGHGTGLEVHEPPSVRRNSQSLLVAGVVTSVEPGIYLSDWGGVRIEDLVYVREADCEPLTRASRQHVFPILYQFAMVLVKNGWAR
jgi:Xaa-Pro aminopeptidase